MSHSYLLLLTADSTSNYWQYISPVVSPIISAAVAFSVLHLNRRYSETAKEKDVREATGRNDGPLMDAWLRLVGSPRFSPWCGAYQGAGQQACALPMPASAGALICCWLTRPAHAVSTCSIINMP